MKEIITLIIFIFLIGCSGTPLKNGEDVFFEDLIINSSDSRCDQKYTTIVRRGEEYNWNLVFVCGDCFNCGWAGGCYRGQHFIWEKE